MPVASAATVISPASSGVATSPAVPMVPAECGKSPLVSYCIDHAEIDHAGIARVSIDCAIGSDLRLLRRRLVMP